MPTIKPTAIIARPLTSKLAPQAQPPHSATVAPQGGYVGAAKVGTIVIAGHRIDSSFVQYANTIQAKYRQAFLDARAIKSALDALSKKTAEAWKAAPNAALRAGTRGLSAFGAFGKVWQVTINGQLVFSTESALAAGASQDQVINYCTDHGNYDPNDLTLFPGGSGDYLDFVVKCCSCANKLPFGNCLTPPPWTEVGAAARGIPKAHGSISLGAHLLGSMLGEVPNPADLKPVNMLRIVLCDPVKAGVMMLIPGLAPYVMSFTTPIGLLLAVKDAGSWDALWAADGEQIKQALGDGADFIIAWFIGGGLVVACIRAALKTLARNTSDVVSKAFYTAIADAVPDIALAVKSPEKWLNPDFYASIGHIFKKAGNSMVGLKGGDLGAATALTGIGVVLELVMSPIMTMVTMRSQTKSASAKDRDNQIKQALWTALDYVSDAVLNVKWSVLKKLPHDQWQNVVTVDMATFIVFTGAEPKLKQFFGWLQGLVDGLKKFVESAGSTFGSLGSKSVNPGKAANQQPAHLNDFQQALKNVIDIVDSLDDAIKDLKDITDTIQQAIDKFTQKLAPDAPPPPGSPFQDGGEAGSDPPKGYSAGGFPWAGVITGGTAGFLALGPVGGAVGAGAGILLLGKKQAQKAKK